MSSVPAALQVEPGQVGGGIEGHDGGGAADGVGQQRGGVAGGRWLVVRAGRVEPDDGVVVDDAAGLVFGDLDEPDADLRRECFLGEADQAGELARQVDGEPAPQVGPAGVEQDVAGVVVAVRAHAAGRAAGRRRGGCASRRCRGHGGSGAGWRRGGVGRGACVRAGRCGWCARARSRGR